MLEMVIFVLMMYLLFKITGFLFKVIGKALGMIFGIIGYVILGTLYIAAFGMAIVFLPIMVLLGIAGIGALMTRTV